MATKSTKIKCSMCEKSYSTNSDKFYSTKNPKYAEYGGLMNICKNCISKMIVDTNGMVSPDRFKVILEELDIVYIPKLFFELKTAETSPSVFLGEYRKKINLNKDYRNATYRDSLGFKYQEEEIKKEEENVTQAMIDFWGEGLENKDYLELDRMYNRFIENEENLDYKKQIDYQTLCCLELKRKKLMVNGSVDELKKVIETISKISQDLNIKAIQKKEDLNNNLHYIVGLVTRHIEDVRKEPILSFKDYAGDYSKSELEKIIDLHYTAQILDSFEMHNPFKDEWEEEKKKYEPTEEQLQKGKESDENGDD